MEEEKQDHNQRNLFFIFLAFLSGVFLPVQGSMNATLLEPTNSLIFPAVISFVLGTISLLFIIWYDPRKNKQKTESTLVLIKSASKVSILVPGLVGAYYVALSPILGAELGFSLFFVGLVTGNLVSAAIADHYGLVGLSVRKLTLYRLLAMFGVFIGSGLSVYESIVSNSDNTLPLYKVVIFMGLSFFSGALFPVQVGLNAELTEQMKTLPHRVTFWSFITGTIYLIIATVVSIFIPSVGKIDFQGLNLAPWKFLGGPLGAAYVFLTIYLGPKIGVSLLLVSAIGGQLSASLVIDTFGFFESTQFDATILRVSGVVVVFISLVIFRFEDELKAKFSKSKLNTEEEDEDIIELDDTTLEEVKVDKQQLNLH